MNYLYFEHEKHAMEYIFAYPDNSGIDTLEALYNWENDNRQLFIHETKEEAHEAYETQLAIEKHYKI